MRTILEVYSSLVTTNAWMIGTSLTRVHRKEMKKVVVWVDKKKCFVLRVNERLVALLLLTTNLSLALNQEISQVSKG